MKGHSAAVLQQCHHARRRGIVFFFAHSLRRLRREYFQTKIAAQLFQLVDRACNRCLPHQPDQHPGAFQSVNLALTASRTAIPGMEGGMSNADLACPTVDGGGMAAMPGPRWLLVAERASLRVLLLHFQAGLF